MTKMTHEVELNFKKGECEYLLLEEVLDWKVWERNCVKTNETDFVITRGKCSVPTYEMFEWGKKKPYALRFDKRENINAFLKFKGLK